MTLKKIVINLGIVISSLFGLLTFCKLTSADVMVYRIYNPHSGEHFYTVTMNKRDSLKNAGL